MINDYPIYKDACAKYIESCHLPNREYKYDLRVWMLVTYFNPLLLNIFISNFILGYILSLSVFPLRNALRNAYNLTYKLQKKPGFFERNPTIHPNPYP